MSTTRPDPIDHQDGDLDAEPRIYTVDAIRSGRGAVTHMVRDEQGKIVDCTQFKSLYRARDLCNALNRAWGDGFAKAIEDPGSHMGPSIATRDSLGALGIASTVPRPLTRLTPARLAECKKICACVPFIDGDGGVAETMAAMRDLIEWAEHQLREDKR